MMQIHAPMELAFWSPGFARVRILRSVALDLTLVRARPLIVYARRRNSGIHLEYRGIGKRGYG